jgi:hypothetical protein
MPPTRSPELGNVESYAQQSLPLTPSDLYRKQWLDKEHHLSPNQAQSSTGGTTTPTHPGASEPLHSLLQRISTQTKDVALQKAISEFQLNSDQALHTSTALIDNKRSRNDQPLQEEGILSPGTHGHPYNCAKACKFVSKSRGCKAGDSCDHCHLCVWSDTYSRPSQAWRRGTRARLSGPHSDQAT